MKTHGIETFIVLYNSLDRPQQLKLHDLEGLHVKQTSYSNLHSNLGELVKTELERASNRIQICIYLHGSAYCAKWAEDNHVD